MKVCYCGCSKIVKNVTLKPLILMAFFVCAVSSSVYAWDIPYVKQNDPGNNKGMCGAACLAMVYQSFGKIVDQRSIFYKIAIPGDKKGSYSVCSHHLMCQDALQRGFYALTLCIKMPEDFLVLYRKKKIDNAIRLIFSQRPKNTSTNWHATVLVDITDSHVVVHDPAIKPSRSIAWQTFMELWQGGIKKPDDYGNCLIAISDKKSGYNKCSVCGRRIRDVINCPACHKAISLEPKDVLGCVDDRCPRRLWKIIYCPHCDNAIQKT